MEHLHCVVYSILDDTRAQQEQEPWGKDGAQAARQDPFEGAQERPMEPGFAQKIAMAEAPHVPLTQACKICRIPVPRLNSHSNLI